MKKRTKAEKFADYADAVQAIRKGEPPRRHGAKDGSIPTHPVIKVRTEFLESTILLACLGWLRKHNILCNRNNVGAGQMGESGYYSYGIRDAGDIVGLLPNGIHFEIEVKRGKGGRLSKGQQKRMYDIRHNGGIYLVVHGCEELVYYFKDLI